MNLYSNIAFIIFTFLFLNCSKKELNNKIVNQLNNESYGSDAQQKMDVYLPANRTVSSTKTIVLIHGGGWIGGDKSDMVGIQTELIKRFPNCAFVNLNYRLAQNGVKHLFPTQENDVDLALSTYLNNSSKYEVSKDLILFGLSAGGHLVLMNGFKNTQGNIKAIIDGFGPTDLNAAWNLGLDFQTLLLNVTGKTATADSLFYAQSSPINYVKKDVPPTLILQGGKDEIVPPSQSYVLRDKLLLTGAKHQLVFYPNEAHGWIGTNLTDTFNKIESFLNEFVF